MKKALSIIMALVVALSACTVMAFATDSTESIIKDKFILETSDKKSDAATFALGEAVFGKVEGTDSKCYAFEIDEAKDVTFTASASSNIEVTIEKAGLIVTGATILKGSKTYDETISLEAGTYYLTVKICTEPVTDDETTEEDTNVDTEIGELSVMSAQAEETAAAEYSFSVTSENLPAAYVKINYKEADLVAGQSLKLELYDCSIKNLNYFWRVVDDPETEINENDVVTVAADGTVTAKMNNASFNSDTAVKVQAVMYYNNVEATKTCTIKAIPANIFLNPYHDTSEQYALKLGVGAFRSVVATTNMGDKEIIWTSSDENVATVSSGKITATGVGQTTVRATIEGTGIYRSITVIVADNYTSVMGVAFDSKEGNVNEGETLALTYTFKTAPEESSAPTNSNVTFISSNPEIATVDANGTVTGVAGGTATITITTEDGSYTDECKVTVKAAMPNWLRVLVAPIMFIYNLIMYLIGR